VSKRRSIFAAIPLWQLKFGSASVCKLKFGSEHFGSSSSALPLGMSCFDSSDLEMGGFLLEGWNRCAGSLADADLDGWAEAAVWRSAVLIGGEMFMN
jgi:hypothetical protein